MLIVRYSSRVYPYVDVFVMVLSPARSRQACGLIGGGTWRAFAALVIPSLVRGCVMGAKGFTKFRV